MRYRAWLIAVLGAVMLFASNAYAQVGLSSFIQGGTSDVTIAMTPSSPAPGDTVALSLESPLIDLSQSSVTWYENGKVIDQGTGDTSASVQTGALGQHMTVSAVVQTPDGTSATTQITIAPTQIDLLVDSDSYVPPFYLGRALPSAGTDLRVQAMARFKRADGSYVPSSSIVYTWKQDGRVVGNLSGTGKSSVILPAAPLYGTSEIEVDARSTDNAFSGVASVALPSTQPVVLLYQDSPLFGVMYYHALPETATIGDSEMTFAAVPYFAQASGANDPRLAYAWTVNGSLIAASASDPSEVTLNAANSDGQATIGLTLTHTSIIYMDSTGMWQIALGPGGASESGSAAGAKDPFTDGAQQ